MKKTIVPAAVLAAAAIAALAGCASSAAPAQDSAPTRAEIERDQSVNNVSTAALKTTIIDWSNRNVGEDPVPNWLKPLTRGNSSVVRNEFALGPADASKVDYSLAQRANRDEARVQAGLLFAAKTANALKQFVSTAAAQSLDQGQMDIVEQITTATQINIAGNRTVTEFWQQVKIEDVENRSSRTEYLYYIVYEMEMNTWRNLVAKYMRDVIGEIPDRRVQAQMTQALAAVAEETTREREKTDAEFYQELELRKQAVKDAQDREMARINQQTAATAAQAQVAQTQVQAEADARYAAYKSGNAATAAAASTTAADFDWVGALSTAADIIL